MPPRSCPQKHRPKSVEKRGLPHQERVRPKRRAQKLRIGTFNVGTMTGRGRALTELMRRRKVDIMCVQETRWSGNKSKELGDGYKLIYGSANLDKRNGVGIRVSENFNSAVVELALEEFEINVFSVYAPQTGCTDDEKDEFWTTLQDEFEKVAEDERCVIGGDLNGHVGRGSDVISRVHGGMCYGEGNEDGERVIDFAISNDMVISNTIFTKRQEHLITYKSD
ncbi:craniofacial development protein 2-like [Penaeus monodon]|uniref:craniofacial development protein 2-like n=1 Tax=Penaeus monodon TaxID=6687 RepID=UPI0018A6E941|nr:craniofacial development protein 2-like [Penaeus monodon]